MKISFALVAVVCVLGSLTLASSASSYDAVLSPQAGASAHRIALTWLRARKETTRSMANACFAWEWHTAFDCYDYGVDGRSSCRSLEPGQHGPPSPYRKSCRGFIMLWVSRSTGGWHRGRWKITRRVMVWRDQSNHVHRVRTGHPHFYWLGTW